MRLNQDKMGQKGGVKFSQKRGSGNVIFPQNSNQYLETSIYIPSVDAKTRKRQIKRFVMHSEPRVCNLKPQVVT